MSNGTNPDEVTELAQKIKWAAATNFEGRTTDTIVFALLSIITDVIMAGEDVSEAEALDILADAVDLGRKAQSSPGIQG